MKRDMNSDRWVDAPPALKPRPEVDTAAPTVSDPDGADELPVRPPAPPQGGWVARWRRRLFPLIIVGVAVAAVALVASIPPRVEEKVAIDVPPVNVSVLTVTPIPEMADSFRLTAVVEPHCVVEVAAEVSGRIERFGRRPRSVEWQGRVLAEGSVIEEGEPIEKGDPILQLNDALLKARYEKARAQLEFDKIEYERIAELYRQGTASKTELDDRRTRRAISKAAADEAAEELERATVVAPMSGVLNRLPLDVGECATPGVTVAEIVDLRTVNVVVDVPERDVHYLQVGDVAEILLRAREEDTRTGAITYISELSDENTRTTRVEITVDNADRTFRSGQIVRARLTRRVLRDVIMIPLGAVIPFETEKAVYVVDEDGRAQRRAVELGFLKGRSVRVLRGLEPGDRLITAGHRYVGPGQPVAIREEL